MTNEDSNQLKRAYEPVEARITSPTQGGGAFDGAYGQSEQAPRAEIVKLALIQFNHQLLKEDLMQEKVIRLTQEQEESLAKAMKSDSVLIDTSVPGALDEYFDKIEEGNV